MPNLYFYLGGVFLGFSVIALLMGFNNPLDIAVVEFFSEHRSAELNSIVKFLSLTGGMPFVLICTALSSIYFLLKRQYRLTIFIIVGVIGSILIGWSLKWAIDRPRPDLIYALVKSYGASFPSAHSLYAATLACIGTCLYQKKSVYFTVIFLLWWLLMGVSRVYAGVHFPTDVFAGWGLGFIWISILWQQLQRINQKYQDHS